MKRKSSPLQRAMSPAGHGRITFVVTCETRLDTRVRGYDERCDSVAIATFVTLMQVFVIPVIVVTCETRLDTRVRGYDEGCDADKIATHTIPMLAVVIPANAGIHRDT